MKFCQKWDSCISLDYNNFDPQQIAEQIIAKEFYTKGVPKDIYWDSEEKKLIKAVDQVFAPNIWKTAVYTFLLIKKS